MPEPPASPTAFVMALWAAARSAAAKRAQARFLMGDIAKDVMIFVRLSVSEKIKEMKMSECE
jgi:hypothetical protein